MAAPLSAEGRHPQHERPQQGQVNPEQKARLPHPEIAPLSAAHPDDHSWAAADPADPRNAGNLGPGGSRTSPDISASDMAGTPGERVPAHRGATGLPGEAVPEYDPYQQKE